MIIYLYDLTHTLCINYIYELIIGAEYETQNYYLAEEKIVGRVRYNI